MIRFDRCRVASPATGRRCTVANHHTIAHERRGRSGRLLETWPRAATDADHQTVCSSAELLEHLRDLIEHAKHEGFGAIAGALTHAEREIRGVAFVGGRRRRARPHPKFDWSRGPGKFRDRT